ncbi:MAG: hypothetical protein HY926_11115 [Elusimicrobia bacterium]|nr:hypothetical protein [Elusimicrobiota bacterium]
MLAILTPVAFAAILSMPSAAQNQPKLTAMLGAEGLFFTVKDLGKFPLLLLLRNDSGTAVEPAKLGSRIFLDGRPVKGGLIDAFFSSGPLGPGKSLAPGKHASTGLLLSLVVKTPGAHRLVWRGAGFSSNEVRLLVAEKPGD